MLLLEDSPALNAGADGYPIDSALDGRGADRFAGAHVDIGAVEMQDAEFEVTAPFAPDLSFETTFEGAFGLDGEDDGYTLLDYSGNDPEEVDIVEVNGDDENVGEEIETAEGGTVTVNADGTFEYTAPEDFVGDDTFTVTFGDGENTNTATITIRIVNVHAYDNSDAALKNDELVVSANDGLLNHTFIVSGDELEVIKVNGSAENVGEEIETAEGGTLIVESDGSYTYTPAEDFTGDDSFTFTVSDGVSEATATVTIHVSKVLAHNAEYDVDEDDSLTVGEYDDVLLNYADDADSDPLTVVAIDGDEEAIGEEVTTAMGGTVTVESDGTFVYTPAENFCGFDYFSYTVSDGTTFSTAIAIINVAPVSDPPVGTNNSVETEEDTPYVFTLADFGFTDVDGDGFVAVKITNLPGAGTLKLNGVAISVNDFISASDIEEGLLEYVPPPSSSGVPLADFQFRVQDDGESGLDLDLTDRHMYIDVFGEL
jgi:hypothetical protein